MPPYDCIVIGGGQFGLHTARRLQQAGFSYLLLERDRIGDTWRKRLEGMQLFTSRQFCALPELPFPGDPEGFASVAEMADYLSQYAQHHKLQIQDQAKVVSLERVEPAGFLVKLQDGTELRASSIVNATGANQLPQMPMMGQQLDASVRQLDAGLSSTASIADRSTVAVVGDGASGRQIADRLAKRCTVILATGSPRGLTPNRILKRDIFWWLDKLRILYADKNSLVARILKKRNPVPCGDYSNRHLQARGVEVVGRALECSGRRLRFKGDQWRDVDCVIWATGYRDDTQWLNLPHCIGADGFVEDYGKTPEPGLFVVGRKWLSCRASELVMGVEADVDRIMAPLRSFLSNREDAL